MASTVLTTTVMKKALYPYQQEGVRWLAERRRAYLADQPGLGKTIQALVAADILKVQPTVICPAVMVPVWEQEATSWGLTPPKTLSYSRLVRDRHTAFEMFKTRPPLVMLDEAHYTKSLGAQRTRRALSLAALAERAWLLSGTPMPNDPRELYTCIRALWPRLLPDGVRSYRAWSDYFCVTSPGRYGPVVRRIKNVSALSSIVRQIMLRRSAAMMLDLPPIRIHMLPIELSDDQRNLLPTKDSEATSRIRRLLGLMKVPTVAQIVRREYVDRVWTGLVLMYHHRDVGRALAEFLSDAHIPYYGFDGSTPAGERATQIEAFQRHKGRRVMLVQQQAGGVGVTLTAATEIVLAEPAWSPGENAQAIRRIYRIGQTAPVRARLVAAHSTLDEAILATVCRKLGFGTSIDQHMKGEGP